MNIDQLEHRADRATYDDERAAVLTAAYAIVDRDDDPDAVARALKLAKRLSGNSTPPSAQRAAQQVKPSRKSPAPATTASSTPPPASLEGLESIAKRSDDPAELRRHAEQAERMTKNAQQVAERAEQVAERLRQRAFVASQPPPLPNIVHAPETTEAAVKPANSPNPFRPSKTGKR